jgi:hypothetical protein
MQWALAVEDVVRLAILVEDRTPEEHEALLHLARAVDRRRAGPNVLEGEVLASVRRRTTRRPRRRVTDELLATVARVYRDRVDEGAPTRAVAEEFTVSHSTAARYVAQARERGLLGRTTAGLAGEREDP